MDERVHDDEEITLVAHRKRSTPWDYQIVLAATERGDLELYKGQCWWLARGAYWQAIEILRRYGLSGGLCMDLTDKRKPYGGFKTELRDGNIDDSRHHIPYGGCLDWAYKRPTLKKMPEFIMATIPGMLGPKRHPRR